MGVQRQVLFGFILWNLELSAPGIMAHGGCGAKTGWPRTSPPLSVLRMCSHSRDHRPYLGNQVHGLGPDPGIQRFPHRSTHLAQQVRGGLLLLLAWVHEVSRGLGPC